MWAIATVVLNNVISSTISLVTTVNSTGNGFVDKPIWTILGQVLEYTNNNKVEDTPPIPLTILVEFDSRGVWRQQCWLTPIVTAHWKFLLGPTLWLKRPNNPPYLDVSDTDNRDPNVITVDVSTEDSTNAVFVDKILSNTNLLNVSIMLLDNSGSVAVTTVTNSNGNYVFYDLPVGTYRVSETNNMTQLFWARLPARFLQTLREER